MCIRDRFNCNAFDIIGIIRYMIDHGNYIMGLLNEKYLPMKKAYGEYDFVHDFLIYGYDDKNRVFRSSGYTSRGHYELYDMSYDDYFQSMKGFCFSRFEMCIRDRLMLTRKTFTNKSITTPMCGFPVHVTEQYTQRLLDAGNDVVAVTHEPGEKLEVKRIVSTAKTIDTPAIPVGRIEYLGSNGAESHDDTLAPPPTPAKKGKVTPNVLYPEIHSEYRTNFRIDRDDIGAGTPLERFYHNKSAIQLLKKLESEHRLAQPYEQNVLSEYVGWGGLSDFFKEDNPHYLELKELLTEDE